MVLVWRFLPMMNLTLLLHKTRSIPAGEEWQNHIKPNDLAFSIVIASDEDNDGELSPIDSKVRSTSIFINAKSIREKRTGIVMCGGI